jgi:hypothetical protein
MDIISWNQWHWKLCLISWNCHFVLTSAFMCNLKRTWRQDSLPLVGDLMMGHYGCQYKNGSRHLRLSDNGSKASQRDIFVIRLRVLWLTMYLPVATVRPTSQAVLFCTFKVSQRTKIASAIVPRTSFVFLHRNVITTFPEHEGLYWRRANTSACSPYSPISIYLFSNTEAASPVWALVKSIAPNRELGCHLGCRQKYTHSTIPQLRWKRKKCRDKEK